MGASCSDTAGVSGRRSCRFGPPHLLECCNSTSDARYSHHTEDRNRRYGPMHLTKYCTHKNNYAQQQHGDFHPTMQTPVEEKRHPSSLQYQINSDKRRKVAKLMQLQDSYERELAASIVEGRQSRILNDSSHPTTDSLEVTEPTVLAPRSGGM